MPRPAVLLACALLSTTTTIARAAPPPKVPPGFEIQRVDPDGQVRFPMFAAFDERGRLFVTESSGLDLYAEISALTRKCRVSVLEDRDGDGRFESAAVFADKLVMPMGALWHAGKLYVPDGPDLVALEDADGDGRAEKRTVVLTGFGHLDNGGLHGVTLGPDGWLYMTCGQPDGYKIKRPDGTWLEGKSGSLLRCRLDGSGAQVLSRGFENLVEVIFFGSGETIGTVNWYQKPEGGIRDALVHLVHGGFYPYVPDMGSPLPVTGPVLPAVTKFPAVALSGLSLQEGTGLGAEYRGNLFSAQHNTRNVGRHVFTRDGSTFRSQDSSFVTSDDPDFHPSDVLEDADGTLLVVDTGSWYIHHCPTGQIRNSPATGGIWRVRRKGATPPEDPRGLKVDWDHATPADLTKLLGDSRPAVRERAKHALVARGTAALPALARTHQTATDLPTRQRALWTTACIHDDAALGLLRTALNGQEPDVVATAARALGARADADAADALRRLLAPGVAPHVRHAAAEALSQCGNADALPAVWAALSASPPPDRMLEHALVHAAHRLGDAAALRPALDLPHPRVQAAALLLLDQPPRPAGALDADAVFGRLTADDEYLRGVALGRVERHPEWAARAAELLRASAGAELSGEADERLRRLVLAFESHPEVQALAAARMQDERLPVGGRVRLVETIARSRLAQAPQPVVDALRELIDHRDVRLSAAAVSAAAALRPRELDEQLAAVAAYTNRPAAVRLEALRAVLPRRPQLDAASFELLASRLAPQSPPLERLAAASLLGAARLDEAQALAVVERVGADAVVSPSAVLPALANAPGERLRGPLLAYLKASLERGWEPAEGQLDPLLSKLPAGADADALRGAAAGVAQRRRSRLAEFEPLLAGGNAERGRLVFFGNKVACGTCHRVGDQGGRVGPDLTKVGAIRAGRDILESIVLPSSTIAQGYDHYVVQTKTGEVHAGVVPQPSAGVLELRDAAGQVTRLHKNDVARLKRQPMSLMPDGLPAAMTRAEFADLLAFLQGLR